MAIHVNPLCDPKAWRSDYGMRVVFTAISSRFGEDANIAYNSLITALLALPQSGSYHRIRIDPVRNDLERIGGLKQVRRILQAPEKYLTPNIRQPSITSDLCERHAAGCGSIRSQLYGNSGCE